MTKPQNTLGRSPDVPIGGVQKLSMVDYPGHPSAVLFTIGCNMRCGYCHNPELVLPEKYADRISYQDIFDFLESRRGRLDGVVISGGEPTIHDELPTLIRQIHERGFSVKLDSNGTNPSMLSQLLSDKLIDYIAMDIKGPYEKYQRIVGYPVDVVAVQESIDLIIGSGVQHEFRTTIVKSQLSVEDIDTIGQMVRGADRFALQKFNPGKTLFSQFDHETTYSDKEFETLKNNMERYVETCFIH
jgi:pyruvate formate lyase activating enzyme